MIAKLDATGRLQWHTFLGSSGTDGPGGLAVDGAGNLFVAGVSFRSWGTPLSPDSDGGILVAKLVGATGQLQWHTFFGLGGGMNGASALALDRVGNVFVAGSSGESWGTPLNPHSGGGTADTGVVNSDMVVVKLDAAGRLQWHTFLGGPDRDWANALVLDGAGNLFVVGVGGASLNDFYYYVSGEILIAKLDATGQLQWQTFLGGPNIGNSAKSSANSLALDGTGNLFMATSSEATWGAPLNPHSGGVDAVIAKLDATRGQLQWHTFLGGLSDDYGRALGLDGAGNLFVAGSSDASWGTPLNPHSGDADILVAKFNTLSSGLASDLVASVLPSSRSVQVGDIATVFATMINSGASDLANCTVARSTDVPASLSFWPTNPLTNAIDGEENQGVNIGAGAAQSFLLGLEPTAPFNATEIQFAFGCDGMAPASLITGVNTLLMSASAKPIADIVALAATLNNDGIVNIPGPSSVGVFSVASVNIGAGATIRVSADTGGTTLPMSVNLCETDPATGVCLGDIAGTVTTNIAAGATPTFGLFVTGNGEVPFDPASNRVFVRFLEANGGAVRGATSVAVRTQ